MILVITSPGCQPCRMTKKMLEDRGIDFTERNVSEDFEALELAKSLGHSSSPVVVTGAGEHWSGFRPDKIDSLQV